MTPEAIIPRDETEAALVYRVIRDTVSPYGEREVSAVSAVSAPSAPHIVKPGIYRVTYTRPMETLDFTTDTVRYGAAYVSLDAYTRTLNVWYSLTAVRPGEDMAPVIEGVWNTIPGNPWA